MRTRVLIAALTALAALGLAGPASAAVSACYSANVTVNGDALVDEAGCVTLP